MPYDGEEHEERFGNLGSAVGIAPLPNVLLQSIEGTEKQSEVLLKMTQALQLSMVKTYFVCLRTFLTMGAHHP